MSLNFLHENIHQGKVKSETTIFSWVYVGMFSHTQTFLHLLQLPLGGLGVSTD